MMMELCHIICGNQDNKISPEVTKLIVTGVNQLLRVVLTADLYVGTEEDKGPRQQYFYRQLAARLLTYGSTDW